MSSTTKKAGSAKVWSDRETVLVAGAAGKLGIYIMGMLQRCAPNNIFSGLGDPRGLVAGPKSAAMLNSGLGSSFVGAFAHESMMRLGDWDDEASLLASFQGTSLAAGPSCLVVGTRYSRLPIAAKNGLASQFDYCLDGCPAGVGAFGPKDAHGSLDASSHAARLQLLLRTAAHPDTAVRHVACVEVPGTTAGERAEALAALAEAAAAKGCGATYLQTVGGCSGGDGGGEGGG